MGEYDQKAMYALKSAVEDSNQQISHLAECLRLLEMSIQTNTEVQQQLVEQKKEEQTPDEKQLAKWVVERWLDEVRHRPLENIYREALDDTWRQIYRKVTDGDEIPYPTHREERLQIEEEGKTIV